MLSNVDTNVPLPSPVANDRGVSPVMPEYDSFASEAEALAAMNQSLETPPVTSEASLPPVISEQELRSFAQKEFDRLRFTKVALRGVTKRFDTMREATVLSDIAAPYGDNDPTYLDSVAEHVGKEFGFSEDDPVSWAEADAFVRMLWGRNDLLKKSSEMLVVSLASMD